MSIKCKLTVADNFQTYIFAYRQDNKIQQTELSWSCSHKTDWESKQTDQYQSLLLAWVSSTGSQTCMHPVWSQWCCWVEPAEEPEEMPPQRWWWNQTGALHRGGNALVHLFMGTFTKEILYTLSILPVQLTSVFYKSWLNGNVHYNQWCKPTTVYSIVEKAF